MPSPRPATTLAIFYLLALAISWALWTPLALGRLGHAAAAPSFLHLLGSLGPALAAALTSLLPFSPVRPAMLLRRLSIGAMPWWALAAAVLLPVAIGIAGLTGQWLVTGDKPNFHQVLQSPEYPYLSPAGWIAASIVFYGFGEEIGWRGLALPILNRWCDGLTAALLMTLPWAAWHLPLLVSSQTYTSLGAAGLAGWVFSLATGSVLLTLFLAVSRGSLIPVAVFHAAIDIVMVNPAVTPTGLNIMGAAITLLGLLGAFACRRIVRNAPGLAAAPASPPLRPPTLE